jgi:glycosyltransferase involved in cell wall biosynthesis
VVSAQQTNGSVGPRVKIIHVPYCFRPDPIGGTEVYVESLAHYLVALGVQSVIAAPGERNAEYMSQSMRVYRFGMSKKLRLDDLYGHGDATAAENFERILDAEQPDLVHLHAFTAAVSLRFAKLITRRGLPLVFTYHTPTVTCQRGTLLWRGTEICDGHLDARRCAACTLQAKNLPALLAEIVAGVPPMIGRRLANSGFSGRWVTTLRMHELMLRRHNLIGEFFELTDAIIVLCDWTRDLLVRLGVPASKLRLSRHGVSSTRHVAGLNNTNRVHKTLRLLFLGRLHPTKGVDVVIEALAQLRSADVSFDIYGVVHASDRDYAAKLRALAAGDPRIVFHQPVSTECAQGLFREYDALVVPSRWLETGPLVVLEAFAAGLPVLGSNLGGIAELVTDNVDGLLVPPTIDGFKNVIQRLVTDRSVLQRLRLHISLPRQMTAVAQDMANIYRELCSCRETASDFISAVH